jgi:hypothetical protein
MEPWWEYFEHRETRRTGANPGEYVVTFCGNSEPRNRKWLVEKIGASEGIRTLDINLGKVALYQAELRSLPLEPGEVNAGWWPQASPHFLLFRAFKLSSFERVGWAALPRPRNRVGGHSGAQHWSGLAGKRASPIAVRGVVEGLESVCAVPEAGRPGRSWTGGETCRPR